MSLVEKTDVLTPKGVKGINELEIGDETYSLNLETGRVEVDKITCKHVTNYSSKILHFYNQRRVNLAVTTSHWMIFRTRYGHPIRKGEADWVAKNMKKVWCFITPNNLPENEGIHVSFIQSRNLEDFLKLIGWYIAEGSIFKNGRNFECSIACTKHRGEIKELLNRMGISYGERDWEVRFKDHELCEALKRYGGRYSNGKRIDHSLFELSKQGLKALFDAMVKGDGHANPKTSDPQYYSTISERLARDFVWLANYVGYATNMKKRTVESRRKGNLGIAKGDPTNWSDLFLINLSSQRRDTRRINVEEESYKGQVYDLVVKDNHNFFAGAKNSGKFALVGDLQLSQDDHIMLPIERKRYPPIICPRCGKRGALQRTGSDGRRYWRVSHKVGDGRTHCWLGSKLEILIK